MSAVISYLGFVVAIPFRCFQALVVDPIWAFFGVLYHGFVDIPFRFVYRLINLGLLPFQIAKPVMKFEYDWVEFWQEARFLYQFLATSVLLGAVFGVFLGLWFKFIHYLLTFEDPSVRLFEWKSLSMYASVDESRGPNVPPVKREDGSLTIPKSNNEVSVGEESIYEDDDGYHLKRDLDRSVSTSTSAADSATDASNLSFANSSDTITSLTTSSSNFSPDGQNLRYRRNVSDFQTASETEAETEMETETETETEDEFYEPSRLITTIEEE